MPKYTLTFIRLFIYAKRINKFYEILIFTVIEILFYLFLPVRCAGHDDYHARVDVHGHVHDHVHDRACVRVHGFDCWEFFRIRLD